MPVIAFVLGLVSLAITIIHINGEHLTEGESHPKGAEKGIYIPFIKRLYCVNNYQVISFSVPVFVIDKATKVAQAALQQPGMHSWPSHCEKHDEHQGKRDG